MRIETVVFRWASPLWHCVFCCRYKSRFAGQVRQEYAEGKAAHHTMGEAVGSVQPKPDEYLKKKTREDVFQKRVKSARVHRKFMQNYMGCSKINGGNNRTKRASCGTSFRAWPFYWFIFFQKWFLCPRLQPDSRWNHLDLSVLMVYEQP